VTHHFVRPLGEDDFGDLASDLFSIVTGAQIGLEYRFGITSNGQIGIHRMSHRTIASRGRFSRAVSSSRRGRMVVGPPWPALSSSIHVPRATL
jgi:hypothetical protein